MSRTFAKFLSLIGHPLLMLTYGLILLLALNPYEFGLHGFSDQRSVLLLIQVFSTTFLIPGLGVALMKPLGLIQSLEMRDKQERIGPYIITGIFYLWLFKNLLNGHSFPVLYSTFVLGATIGLFFDFFLNIFTKISAHATGWGGLVAMVLLTSHTWGGGILSLSLLDQPLALSLNAILIFVVIMAGLVGTARLALGAHVPVDLYRGYGIGFGSVLLAAVILMA